MKSNFKQLLIAAISILLGFAAVYSLSNFIVERKPALAAQYEDEDLALQGAKLKGFSLGFEGLFADWYWMQSLQYIGGKIIKSDHQVSLDNLKSLNPRLLYPYLDAATTLDPHFIEAYSYGAIVLPAIDTNQAIKIAEKGIENNPGEWRLYQYLGYIYWRSNNFQKAAEVYSLGANIKNAPPFLKLMAAKVSGEGGSRDTARVIYTQMLEEAQDSQIKENASLRLLQLDSLEEIDILQKVLNEFKSRNNRCASNWKEIFPYYKTLTRQEGDKLKFDKEFSPVDPKGFTYYLEANACQPRISVNSVIPSN